jgi:polar amino acid transport system substrate-binding protein
MVVNTMRKKTIKHILLTLVMSPILASTSVFGAVKQEKVTIRGDIWCPYNCEPTSPNPGLMIEVAYKAFGKENVDYQLLPWKRAIIDTRDGQYDAIVGAAQGDAPDFMASYALANQLFCFVKKSGDAWMYSGHGSLKGKILGYIGAYAYPDFINAFIADKGNKTTEKNGDGVLVNLMKMIQAGRIDVVTDDKAVLTNTLESNADLKKDVVDGGCAVDSGDVTKIGISFTPKKQIQSQKNLKKLNDAIRAMIDSGEMKKIADKYKVEKWW